MPATITAIVTTRDAGRLLPEAVHSILAQTRMVAEIIIWDDGSTDDTPTIAAQLKDILDAAPAGSAVPTFQYHRAERMGTGAALNRALGHATGDYVWICGAQNLALDHTMAVLATLLDQTPEATMATGTYRRFRIHPRTRKQTDLAPEHRPDLTQGSVLRHLLESRYLPGEAAMMRRSALLSAGTFREDLRGLSQADMHIRLACQGPVRVTDDPVFLQRLIDDPPARTTDEAAAKADLALIAPFRDRIPLSIYEGMFRAEDPKIVRRAALLQRACVFARHTDWLAAARDFTDAAKLAPGHRLSPLEKEICDRAMSGPFGVDAALTPESRKALREAAGLSAAGGSIARALAGGMAWRSKDAMARGRLADVAAMGKFVSALRIYTGGHGRGDRPGQVFENAELPDQSYLVI